MKLFQIDAFSDRLFGGNPAAVIPLQAWPNDTFLQQLAQENNLPETAFLVRNNHGYDLRWFTPTVEVDLCGHATLAAAWVVFHELGFAGERIRFDTASGPLHVSREQHLLAMDFPSRPARPAANPQAVEQALGMPAREILQARDTLVILDNAEQVRACQPDMRAIEKLDTFAVIISALGDDCDFVSRFFAPGQGIPEDPVTGSAHCTLAPYWAGHLGKTALFARQLSARGGAIHCTLLDERVRLAGQARCYLKGDILL